MGIDKGFGYAPGASVTENAVRFQINKNENIAWHIARSNVHDLISSPIFEKFFNGDLHGEFPIAVLPPKDQALLQSQTATVLLSQHSLSAHLNIHPEIEINDYLKIQEILDFGDIYQQGDSRLIYQTLDGIRYRAVLKKTGDKLKNYFLTLFRNDSGRPPKDAVKVER